MDVDTRQRTAPELRRGAVAMLPLVTALVPLGLAVGARVGTHPDPAAALGATWLLYGASAHLALLQLTETGAGVVATVATCLLIQARLLVYSAALGTHWRHERRGVKALLAAGIVDPSFALGSARYGEAGTAQAKRAFYVGAAGTLWVGWSVLIVAGTAFGSAIGRLHVLALALPVSLAVTAAPALRSSPGRAAVAASSVVALASGALPSGTGLVAAIVAGAVAGVLAEERAR